MKTDVLPVLVVGAGPSGLMMAHELKRLGIAVVIVDKEAKRSPYSRAIAVQIRTLEIFHGLGLIDHLKQQAQEMDGIEIFAEGARPVMLALDRMPSFYDRVLIIDQSHTEKVLEDAVLGLGQEILRGVELVDFVVDENGVRANLRMPHGEIKGERFSYVIGADGAHSVVRKKMGNQFHGTTYDDAFILADVECEQPFDHHTFRVFFRKKRFLALIPMHDKNHFRLISVRRGETKKMGPAPTIEEFEELAKAVVPYDIVIKNPSWVSRFFVQCRSASRYQDDRLFLVGDAAHLHSPAGGQGMNTGLQDAFNLAWKLALVMKGDAEKSLLSTYHDERKPVGDFLIDRTDRLFKLMVQSSLIVRLLRRVLTPLVSKSSRVRARLLSIISQTAIRYSEGVVCGDGEHVSFNGIRIGKRVPNVKLTSKKDAWTDVHTLALADGKFSVWLWLPHDVDVDKKIINRSMELIEAVGKIVTTYVVAKGSDLSMTSPSSFPLTEPHYVVVRPDHHVFCVGPLKDLLHGVEKLRSQLMR